MAEEMTLDRLDGSPVVGSDGSKIGTVADIYFDKETRKPEWALVNTGLFGSKHSFVPVTNASVEGDQLRVPFTKDQVKDAPNLDDDGELSQDEELTLSKHYGMNYTEAPSDTGLPQGGGTGMVDTDVTERDRPVGDVKADVKGGQDSMTLSEEELKVGTMRRPSGLARLRKHVVEEKVSTTVPVEHQEATIHREPMTDGSTGATLGEEEIEVTLTDEEVVVDKEVVAKERVSLDVETETEQAQVEETVAKEVVEIEGDIKDVDKR